MESKTRHQQARDQIDDWFQYHAPTRETGAKYDRIRSAAKALAYMITNECPECADRTAALRKLREAVMTANASIACDQSLGGCKGEACGE